MEGSVVLIHVLMDFTVARDAVVCRLLRARITEKAFAGSKAPVHDMNDDCFGTQPEGPSFTEIGTRTTNPLDHVASYPTAVRSPRSPLSHAGRGPSPAKADDLVSLPPDAACCRLRRQSSF